MAADLLRDMDDETLQLIVELQQADLREPQQGSFQLLDGHQDDQMALELYQNELASLEFMALGRAMARRIEEEGVAEAEHGEPVGEAAQHLKPAEQPYQPESTAECVICREVHDTRELYENHGCQDMYCADCLRDLFEASINDESLFPPRCCGHAIPINDISGQLFSDDFVEIFHAKSVEYSTTDRTYCCIPTCSAFIPPATVHGDVGTCPDCRARVCVLCKSAEHQDHTCTQDAATQQVLQLAKENNWKRCPSCQAVVELGMGCYHITCRCQSHFCYLCLAEWKNCQCPMWDEGRLLAAGEERVQRDPRARNLAQEERQAAVQQAQIYIEENHDCNHAFWRSISINPNTRHLGWCLGCDERMSVFIYQCRQCEILACRRCRYNRFR
ncbi:IBR finger domain-containing protein [Colletotrichum graminicola]|uniref:RBR-type E3 ubiquitin transferase n=1 Tax=Colletotrichum graminicola (strain M1.001 / M2 / FGSC 10212) TaxID=645133 RepID=E3QIP8_COLGM|nr:IBR finger domain-containing protein [Colletotrichum graminicola M1.001]EFQ30658.1 IBR finger domain-containing protein [Colletotrichum graminicola M1.001]WDK21388.1 IBR finger domain-containing protein [Colletotrichum graminicola]